MREVPVESRRLAADRATVPPDGDPGVVELGAAGSTDDAAVGPKAAKLSRAGSAGLSVLPGFALTPAAASVVARLTTGRSALPPDPAVRATERAWTDLTDRGTHPVVVRSSSAAEDGRTSSQAGRFTSVVDVRTWPAFTEAVRTVVESGGPGAADMAVLVQRHLDPACSGVLFGLDPVTGRRDRRVVTAVAGGPQALVSGEVDGTRYLLSRRGRRLDTTGEPVLTGRQCIALARLAARTARLFGGPQDMEWAFGTDGRLWLLQSRPVTAAAPAEPVSGPLLGPGPVAETFPDPLWPLEESLWVEPMRRAVTEALRLAGSFPARRLAASPVVTTVAGRIVADLELLGAAPPTRTSLWARVDPRPGVRRLGAAWRVGRLRAALPILGADVVAGVDAELTSLPPLGLLADHDLMLLLRRTSQALAGVHGHEMLAGLLPPGGDSDTATAASAALAAVAAGRAEGMTDPDIVAATPVVLALTVPAIGTDPVLPPVATAGAACHQDGGLGVREALRLRARWLHELSARAAAELGRRLALRGVVGAPGEIRCLDLDELDAVVSGAPVPADALTRRVPVTPPLPAAFRLTATGSVVPVVVGGGHAAGGGGRGASPGRGMGRVDDRPTGGSVLVVPTLDPRLAPLLPGLAGLVAETGSELSHLAILAREYGVPTVVGVNDAVRRFPPGTVVVVDGTTGDVVAVEPAPSSS